MFYVCSVSILNNNDDNGDDNEDEVNVYGVVIMAILIDITVLGDTSVEEKISKYQNLARELKMVWKVVTRVILTVLGTL